MGDVTKEDGLAHGQPYGPGSTEGRFDIDGVEWFACDPYPTWFYWDEDGVLHTRGVSAFVYEDYKSGRFAAPWADGGKLKIHVKEPEDCYGVDAHDEDYCDGIVRRKWSGVGCRCGNLWFCL